MKKMLEFLRSEIDLNNNESSDGRSELIGSAFFIVISAVLTILNVVKHAGVAMTTATSVLVVGFSAATALAAFKKTGAAKVIILVLCGLTFTLFAVIGGNQGFAILWIMLVPIIGGLWVGLKAGLILSTYFLVFIFVMFYSPLSAYIRDFYTPTFMLRFPVLYLASYGASLFLMWEREILIRRLNFESYYDALTGLRNRRSYNEQAVKIKKEGMAPGFTCFSFDLNSLKYANDNFGHDAGDELIKAAADIISKNFSDAQCFRTGGDEFIAFANSIDAENAIEGMNRDIQAWKGEYSSSISIAVGYASLADNPGLDFKALSLLADERMYTEKSGYYEEHNLSAR